MKTDDAEKSFANRTNERTNGRTDDKAGDIAGKKKDYNIWV